MNGITKITNRIAEINRRFSRMSGGTDFSQLLEKTQFKSTASKAGSTADVQKIIALNAQKYGVDTRLAMAVAETESGFDVNAVSAAGAVGVMQLMPETARELGVADIHDPRQNIEGGVRYLRKMLDMFNNDVVKAVAAYNAGPAAVKAYNGVPPYAETRAYVNKVLALYK